MSGLSLLAIGVPLMQRLFAPMSMLEKLQLTPILILAVLELCLAAAFLALWRAARDYRVFRSLGIFNAIFGVQQLFVYFGGLVPCWSLRAIAAGVLVEAAGEAMQVPQRRWTRLFWPVYLFVAIAVWFPSLAFTNEWSVIVSEIPLAILIVQGFRRGNTRDRMIAAGFSMIFFVRLTLSATVQRLLGIREFASLNGWHWSYTTIGLTLLGTVTLAIFVRDLIRDRIEKQRLATELAASRAVQQVLIPEKLPPVSGLAIQSVYKPYGEVGGDFFQILPLANDEVLIAIGDVSGKGMPAAMLVSLLVGTLHALVETTTCPAALLAGLNRAVLGRSRGGFTTCLILHIDAGGALTIANAAHISPYLNGEELRCENGLPLGLVAGTDYVEARFQMQNGEQLTLVTDGVVEARNEIGELFGFARTAACACDTAEAITEAAERFGQDDDITVLTVARMAHSPAV